MDYMKNFFFYLHFIFTIFVISISFLPIKIIKYGFFLIPLLLTILWLFYKCPLNKLHQNPSQKNYHFIKECLLPICPTLTVKTCHKIATFLTCLIPTIIVTRLLYF